MAYLLMMTSEQLFLVATLLKANPDMVNKHVENTFPGSSEEANLRYLEGAITTTMGCAQDDGVLHGLCL